MSRNEGTPGPPPEARQFSLRRRFLALPTLISFALAIVFLYFLLARFDIDLSETWGHVRRSQPGYLALAFVLYYLTFPLRAYRWRLLLRNVGTFQEPGARRPSLLEHVEIILLSWFANSISWFRLGDAYRAYLLGERARVSFSRTAGTVVAERALDIGVVLALLLLASIGLLHGDTGRKVGAVVAAATALAVVVGAALLMIRVFGLRLSQLLPKRVQQAFERFLEGVLGSFRRLPWLIPLGIAIWLLEASRLYFVVQALGFDVSLALILFAALAHSLLTTIPVTPGGLGFVELGLTGLLVLALPRGEAAGVTLLDRSITYLSIVAVGGLLFAVRQLISFRHSPLRRPRVEGG